MMTYTGKQVKGFIEKNDKRWNETIREKYILLSEHTFQMKSVESKRKKEFRILFRAIQDLNKTMKKLKSQEEFLNTLLDKREAEINQFVKVEEEEQ